MTENPSLKLFGERITVKEVSEEIDSNIVFPDNRQIKYSLGEVTATGNGVYLDGSPKKDIYFEKGDVVVFQFAGAAPNAVYTVGEEKIRAMHQNDAFAKLKGKKITINEFIVTGPYVLIEPRVVKTGLIEIPDSSKPLDECLFFLIQRGDILTDVEIGQQVLIEAGKLFPILIDGKQYFYTMADYVYGAVEGSYIQQYPDTINTTLVE